MIDSEFQNYSLRVDLQVLLRYEALGASVAQVVRRLTYTHAYPTVVHVHFDEPVERTGTTPPESAVYDMPVIMGVFDKPRSRNVLFNVKLAETHITDCFNQPLRRLDIHYNEVDQPTH